MSAVDLAPEIQVFPLRPGRGTVALHATGFRAPSPRWPFTERFTAYADLTHLQLGARSLRIGARNGVQILQRSHFTDPHAPEALVRALLERMMREPTGPAQLARMAELEETARHPAPLRATWLAILLCVAVFAAEAVLGPVLHHAGFMNPELVQRGEPWRLVTANFLHASLAHLVLNSIGLLVFGALVERPLGALRTVFILGLSGLSAMATAWIAGYDELVGASGMVAGLAGAALWLELRRPERLPAIWRVPRRLLIGVFLAQALLDHLLPFVAGLAHVGGFAAGVLAAALCAGPRLRREPLRPSLAVATALVVAIAAASLVSAARFLVAPAAWEAHAARLLALDRPPALLMNDAAWLIAISPAPSRKALDEALELAARAARATGHRDPNVLDTLAEAQFRGGDAPAALATIDEAIALAPDQAYFREQRRRFAGQRAADDRPAPPAEEEPVPSPSPSPGSPPFEDPGISI